MHCAQAIPFLPCTQVSAAVVSYLGAFTAPYRDEAVAGWLAGCRKAGIQTSPRFSLAGALADPVKVRSEAVLSLNWWFAVP